jgi:hypothetical protein
MTIEHSRSPGLRYRNSNCGLRGGVDGRSSILGLLPLAIHVDIGLRRNAVGAGSAPGLLAQPCRLLDNTAASASIVRHDASGRLYDVSADVVDRGDKLLAHC